MLTTLNIDIQAMLVWLTLPFYDFCGFRSVAVNSVYKLQFFSFISSMMATTVMDVENDIENSILIRMQNLSLMSQTNLKILLFNENSVWWLPP